MRLTALVLVGLLVLSCGGDGVTIYAPPQLAEASIFIDGKPAGRFQKTQRQYRWVGWKKMREEIGAPARSETIAKLPTVTAGAHRLRVEKSGYAPIEKSFHYSAGRLEIEIDDEEVKANAAAQ
jgi:hypothetical protein